MADTAEAKQLLFDSDDSDDSEAEVLFSAEKSMKAEKPVKAESSAKDPILESIGEFGPYQLYVCLVGLLFTIPHCWASLSLKFIGMRTNFTCADTVNSTEELRFDGSCSGPTGPCQTFKFNQTEFSSTIVERWSLVCEKEGMDSIAQSVYFCGCLVGVIVAGLLADRFGRKKIVLLMILVFCCSGVLGGLTSSFNIWLALRFVYGAANMGMSTVRYTIQVEMLGSNYRTWGSMMGAMGWSTGYMVLPIIVYGISDMAHLEILIAMCVFPFISLYWLYPESPKWLLSVGRTAEAEEIVRRICYWNSKPFKGLVSSNSPRKPLTDPDAGLPGLSSLCQYPNLRRNLLCAGFSWFSLGMSYYGIALHTPEFGGNIYMVFFLAGLIEIPANIAAPMLMNCMGRKKTMLMGFSITSVSLFSSAVIPRGLFYKEWVTVTLITFGKFGVGFCFDSAYVWTSEVFPTVIRNSGLSICSSCARLGAIIAPLIVEIDKENPMAPILIYGMVATAAILNTTFIYPETKDCDNLPDSLEEGELLAVYPRSTLNNQTAANKSPKIKDFHLN